MRKSSKSPENLGAAKPSLRHAFDTEIEKCIADLFLLSVKSHESAIVEFKIEAQVIINVGLFKSSGHEEFDRAALLAVQGCCLEML